MPLSANAWIALILLATFFIYLSMIAFGFIQKHTSFGTNLLKYGQLLGAIHMAILTVILIAITIKFVSPIIAFYAVVTSLAGLKLFGYFMDNSKT